MIYYNIINMSHIDEYQTKTEVFYKIARLIDWAIYYVIEMIETRIWIFQSKLDTIEYIPIHSSRSMTLPNSRK